MSYYEILGAITESNEAFVHRLQEWLSTSGLTISAFCEKAQLPESTIYKILSDPDKDFRISTFRHILQAVKKIEGLSEEGTVIGIITTRGALSSLGRQMAVKGQRIAIKEYPASTIEEEIIQGVHAERAGVKGIICGPIAATTLEKVVDIPVIGFQFEERLLTKAIHNIVKKL
ncbi:MAG: transcriptional regulator [Thermoplasmatota archaeon]